MSVSDGVINQIFKKLAFPFFGFNMSSSYVEVRESENGTSEGLLQFQLNDCESNGIDIQTHIDGEPPKDHTYNKDPGVDQEMLLLPTKNDIEISENEEEEQTPRKSGRAQRNIKHKIIKPRNEVAKPIIKKESPKKSPRTKAPSVAAEIIERKPTVEKTRDSVKSKSPVEVNNVGNRSFEQESAKKRSRKRTFEEELNVEIKQEVKPKKKKKTKPVPEKVEVVPDVSEEVEDKKRKNKEDSPVKKSPQKNVKAKVSESKSTKKTVTESPTKSAKKDEGSGNLPAGWTRKVVERKSGKTAGMFDIYIYSPDGIKFRSRPDIAAYLHKTKSNLRLEDFNFKRSGASETSPSSSEKKKPTTKTAKVEPSSSKKKKGGSPIPKRGATLKVKIATPKKHLSKNEKKKEKTPPPVFESLPSTSGLQSKRNRKKKVYE